MTLYAALILVFILIAIAMIVVSLILLRPVDRYVQRNNNNLQNNYNAGDNAVANITNYAIPISISAEIAGPVKSAATYSAFQPRTVLANATNIANSFKVTNFLTLVALQVNANFYKPVQSGTPRSVQVGVYDLVARKLLLQTSVITSDSIVDGFLTHFVGANEAIVLVPDTIYAISVVLNAFETCSIAPNNIQTNSNVVPLALARKDIIASGNLTLDLPGFDDFKALENNVCFASFQFQEQPRLAPLFQVDIASGFATFPTNYIYDLSLVVTKNNVLVDGGLCLDSTFTLNIVNNIPGYITINPQVTGVLNGLDTGVLEANQWYFVYVLASSITTSLVVGALLSKSQQNPSFLPTGYSGTRNVGAVRSNADATGFVPMVGTGSGQRRRQIFNSPLPVCYTHNFNFGDITYQLAYEWFPLVPPTATSVVLEITVDNTSTNALLTLYISNVDGSGTTSFEIGRGVVSFFVTQIAITDIPIPHANTISMSANNQIATGIEIPVFISVSSFYADLY
jgi:hypothetical protein